jgi:flagellar basal body rod protein FlgB
VAKESKTELVLSAEGKNNWENQNGVGIDIEIKELNRIHLNYQKNMF